MRMLRFALRNGIERKASLGDAEREKKDEDQVYLYWYIGSDRINEYGIAIL